MVYCEDALRGCCAATIPRELVLRSCEALALDSAEEGLGKE